ncbi:hypothetical protein LIER_34683 [Lithospermum erythrorhizon]|uniref:60S ribosomal export protein NMD3 n=1 Tax=Lithospermum erythrorhizon TaxID=34254 RepID=A0AAV3S2Z4_LITER
MNGAIIEQSYSVEYVVKDQMCESCSRVQANPDQWGAVVQLRQYVSHRRTFFYLEQLILKHDAAAQCIRIMQMDNGIDFYFANRSHAVKFLEFVGKVTPVSSRRDKQLVSHDVKSSTYNNKFTFSVTIPPVCREDLICLPPTLATSLGNIGPLVICTKVSNSIALLDPLTLRESFLDGHQYWSSSLKSFLSSKELVEYIILHVTPVDPIKPNQYSNREPKYKCVDAQVARVYNNRESKDEFARPDFGKIFHVRTHLGDLLKDGDYALGYDLVGTNSNDIELDKYKGRVLPEVVLIKKSYKEKRQKNCGKPRSWKLKSLEMEGTDREEKSGEYEKFLSDLEENPELWGGTPLYRNEEYHPDGDDELFIPLEQLLADLDISDQETEPEDDDDAMRD